MKTQVFLNIQKGVSRDEKNREMSAPTQQMEWLTSYTWDKNQESRKIKGGPVTLLTHWHFIDGSQLLLSPEYSHLTVQLLVSSQKS